MIYKISDDQQRVIVDESPTKSDYEAFHEKVSSAVDHEGRAVPRFDIYDVEYDLGQDGKRQVLCERC